MEPQHLNDEDMSKEDKLSLVDLPLEMRARIIEEMDFLSRFDLRKTCRSLYNGDALAKLKVEELALFRTGDVEFTLSLKDQLSETWLFVQNKNGRNIQWWKDDDDFSYKEMDKDARNTPFDKEETRLGELTTTMSEYLRRSAIGTVTIDGFHCSDLSMAQLCGLLRHQSIEAISITAPFSTTSDASLAQLIHGCPNLRRFNLSAHRCTHKDIVIEKDFLLFATSRLDKLAIHSRVHLRQPRSEDYSEVDDDLLMRLVSDKCTHLSLLYYLPLLTAQGIAAVVQHICTRNEPEATFRAYFRSELIDSVWSLIGENVQIDADNTEMMAWIEKSNVRFTVYTFQHSQTYCKIVVTKEPIVSTTPTTIPT